MAKRIVLIDDEVKLLRALKKALEQEGFEVFEFSDSSAARKFLESRTPDLVVSDIRMRGFSGIDLLAWLTERGTSVPCMLMTAYSSVETAVSAVKLGARDYLRKPFELGEFKAAVRRVLESAEQEQIFEGRGQIIGSSRKVMEVLSLIDKVASTESTVLLQGESGTGKELVARILHERSSRCQAPFIPVNCSAIPESLFESEVFGHVRGSFTGAVGDKPGLFREAEGGTLFLDEIGDLAFGSQAKLLRVLQDGTFKRVGDARTQNANVRIIAATNRLLHAEVAAGKFREDLLYRINVVEIQLPPLRERLEDIPALTEFIIGKFARKHARTGLTASPELLRYLQEHSWPGNLRELENVLERAVILKRTGQLKPEDVPLQRTSVPSTSVSGITGEMSLDRTMEKIEEELILRAINSAHWNLSKAAEVLGVTRQNLHYKLKKYGIRKNGV